MLNFGIVQLLLLKLLFFEIENSNKYSVECFNNCDSIVHLDK